MPSRLRHLLVLLLAAGVAGLSAPAPGGAADVGALQKSIASSKARERSLGGAAAHLSSLIATASKAVAVVQRRLADVQSTLNVAQAKLTSTEDRLRAARARLIRLRGRLGLARSLLTKLLVDRYENGKPEFVDVLLGVRSFSDLLEQITFAQRVQERDTQIVGDVRGARNAVAGQERVLARLLPGRRRAADAVLRERNAVAGINASLVARESALQQARAARLAALHDTVAGRATAQKVLNKLLAAQARANLQPGPGGPWAIPWPVVQCESGGQNLPPNSASASGYYQMLDTTWHGLGGRQAHAYLASKNEQDMRAATLWNHGRGASNWVCAVMLGLA